MFHWQRTCAIALGLLLLIATGCNSGGSGFGTSAAGDVQAERGIELYENGDYQGSVSALESAIAAGVKQHQLDELNTILGNAYNELERYDDAIAAHRRALKINPRSYQAWVNLGIVYRLTEKYDQAESCYQKALAIDPNYAELHASLGALYIYQEQPEKAVESLRKAIQLDDSLAISHSNLALALAMLGNFDESEASLQRAVQLGYQNGPAIQERIDVLKSGK